MERRNMSDLLNFLEPEKVVKKEETPSNALLDRIFNATEKDVGTFADVLKRESILEEVGSENSDLIRKSADGKPAPISKEFHSTELIQGFIKVVSGWNKQDYVWHLSPAHAKKPWNVTIERVIFAVVHTINEVLPREQVVNIYPPYADWDIAEITLKAIDLKSLWSVDQKDLDRLSLRFLEVLNPLVL